MKKPWSITTTLRNPERSRDFLLVLEQLENSDWDTESQMEYQILLIQNRVYGYGSSQFYNGLSQAMIDLVDDSSQEISFEQAQEIFNAKEYEDPAMRGRQSLNALKKFGFVLIENRKLKITELGRLFLKEDFDFGEVYFKSFLKWQLPNPDSRDYPDNGTYDIKPFIGTLHLINSVNQKEESLGNEPKGISKKEFSLFAPTLVNYNDIERYAESIISLREKLNGKTNQRQREILEAYRIRFAGDFLHTDKKREIDRLLNNLHDYGDNAIRYFRLTRYIHIRGGGFYVDLEPRRLVEINSLLAYDNAKAQKFESKKGYFSFISDIAQPQLPWETKEKYSEIAKKLINEIHRYEADLDKDTTIIKTIETLQDSELREYLAELRRYRRQLQEEENQKKSQAIEHIESYIESLENIFNVENGPILLEKYSALGLHALNDALKIQPNHPVGDDNEPTFTAPANTPDIECFYEDFNAICEVTMLNGRNQWYNEGQPVMRHLRDFENKNGDKPSYCLFVAPRLHRDTINTFWTAIKYEYEGKPQRIVPLSIDQFVSILKRLVQMKNDSKFLKHSDISRLYDEILQSSTSYSDSGEWIRSISETISTWGESLVTKS